MKKTGSHLPAIHQVGDTRFELVTPSVSGKCATTAPTARVILQPNQSRLIGLSRADNGTRTRGLNLGKVALYQLSYVRIRHPYKQQMLKIRAPLEKCTCPACPAGFRALRPITESAHERSSP